MFRRDKRRCIIPNDLRIRVGVEVGTITFGGTPAQVADVLRRFAISQGIPITGTATENLVAILEHFRDEAKQGSKQAQRAELRAANEAGIETTVELDNAL